jgi:hypothetical protein
MSMLGHMLGGQIKEGEAALQALDKEITAAEAKITPFLNKVTPIAAEVVTDFVAFSPILKGAVTPTEIAEFASGIAALPALLTKLHGLITAAETKLGNL